MIIKFTCEYNGKNFCGFQRQKTRRSLETSAEQQKQKFPFEHKALINLQPIVGRGGAERDGAVCTYTHENELRTVQEVLENALEKYLGEPVKITASGRTDAGVHANGQVCSFKLTNSKSFLSRDKDISKQSFDEVESIDLFKLCTAINFFLPPDVSVKDFEKAPDNFNAQFSAKSKTYIYRCFISPYRSALRDNFYYQLYKQPNLQAMQTAAQILIGEHNFKSFCSEHTDKTDFTRIIQKLEISQINDEVIFTIKGNGFLRNMVRIIVGTLLEVGSGKTTLEQLKTILASQNRQKAGQTAPAHALTLNSVEY